MRHPKLTASIHVHKDDETQFEWCGDVLFHNGERFTAVAITPNLEMYFHTAESIDRLIFELEKARAAMRASEAQMTLQTSPK